MHILKRKTKRSKAGMGRALSLNGDKELSEKIRKKLEKIQIN